MNGTMTKTMTKNKAMVMVWANGTKMKPTTARLAAELDNLITKSEFRIVAAPLSGPQSRPEIPMGPSDLVSAIRKAAQAAAMAASEQSQDNNAHEKHNVLAFPARGNMTNWVYILGTATVVVSGFG